MNWVDVVILVILLFFVIKGWRWGLIRGLLGIAGFFLSIFLAAKYTNEVKTVLLKTFSSLPPSVAAVIGFLILFLALSALFHLISSIIQRLVHLTLIGAIDTLGGILLGGIIGGFVASLLLLFLSALPLPEAVSAQIENSKLAKPTRNIVPYIFNKLKEQFPQIKEKASEKSLKLPLNRIPGQAKMDSLIQEEIKRQTR